MTAAIYTHNAYHNMYDPRQEMPPLWARIGTAWGQDTGNLSEMQIPILEPGTQGEEVIPLFVPLCHSCHGKTQKNRPYWIMHFTNITNQYYGGKCYFTKEEMVAYREAAGGSAD